MNVYYKEFMTDTDSIRGIQEIKNKGALVNDIYVLTHESDRTNHGFMQ